MEEWNNQAAETIEYKPEEIKKLQEDGFYKLQNATVDELKGEEELPRLAKLLDSKVKNSIIIHRKLVIPTTMLMRHSESL